MSCNNFIRLKLLASIAAFGGGLGVCASSPAIADDGVVCNVNTVFGPEFIVFRPNPDNQTTECGQRSVTTGNRATAVGNATTAAQDATAVGANSSATAESSTAIGSGANASGSSATAIGTGATAGATGSVAIGAGSVANRPNTVSVGAIGTERQVTNVAAGTQATDAVNLGQLGTVSDATKAAQDTATAAQITATGAHSIASAAFGLAKNSVQYVQNPDGSNSNMILLSGTTASGVSGLVTIRNVAAGIDPTDAVNRAQLDAVIARNSLQGASIGSVQIGDGCQAIGGKSVCVGFGNQASGDGAVAMGDPNIATGQGAVAIGADNEATGTGAVALGNLSIANGNSAVALGDQANAGAHGAIALGYAASAGQNNAVALGSGAITTRANQVTLGGTSSSVTVGSIASSTAAQVGPTDVMTVDASGTIGRDPTIRAVIAAQGAAISTVQALDSNQNSRLNALENSFAQFNANISGVDKRAEGGIAAAMAMGGTIIPADANGAMSFNLSTYRGQQGFSGVIVQRVAPKVYANFGIAGSSVKGSTGARVGVTIGW